MPSTRRSIGFRTVLVGLLVVAAGIPALSAQFPVRVVDDRGRQISLDAAPERVIVLGAFYAQILLDLDSTALVVGIGDSPDNPAAYADTASVGPVYAPSVELMLSLAPDLVLGATDWNGDRATLENVGISVYTAPWLTTIDSIYDAVRRIGLLIDRETAAANRIEILQQSIRDDQERIPANREVSAAYVYASTADSLYAMGEGTPEHDLLALAGVTNVFADLPGYTQISIEALLGRDPMVIVTDPTQFFVFYGHPVLSTLSAVVSEHLVGIPARFVGSTQIAEAFSLLIEGVYGD